MKHLFISIFLLTNIATASYSELAKLAGISTYKMSKIIHKLIKIETSTGKYDEINPYSGAYGRYQIMPQTAKRYAKKLSIPINKWKIEKNQDKIFQAMLKDNIVGLKKQKYKITLFALYGTHQQGLSGFFKITKNRKLTKYIERNMRKNLPKKYNNINRNILRIVWIMYWKKKLNKVM
jgi:hypothetical protein